MVRPRPWKSEPAEMAAHSAVMHRAGIHVTASHTRAGSMVHELHPLLPQPSLLEQWFELRQPRHFLRGAKGRNATDLAIFRARPDRIGPLD